MSFLPTPLLTNEHAFSNAVFLEKSSSDFIEINRQVFRVKSAPGYASGRIGLSLQQRLFLQVTNTTELHVQPFTGQLHVLPSATIAITPLPSSQTDLIKFDATRFIDDLREAFVPIHEGLKYNFRLGDVVVQCLITGNPDTHKAWVIGESTLLNIVSTSPRIHIPSSATPSLFKGDFDFKSMGIGGLDAEFNTIFRRAFAPRLLPETLLHELGIHPPRGLLLFGPPGCGKTLIARKIGSILNCHEPKIVNGPSLLDKFVGGSEENVRRLFADAIADKTNEKLHLIICDEFDAIGGKRGSRSDSTGVTDKVVNQLLSMIDGPAPLNNILLICMTNNKHALDEALLRPGRLEIHIEIQLPDESGRQDILQIHTRTMAAKHMDTTVNLHEIANKTVNYTGAELEAVVRTAVTFALAREINPSDLKTAKAPAVLVTQKDLLTAIQEVRPMFGVRSPDLAILTQQPLQFLNESVQTAHTQILDKIARLRAPRLSVLLTGPPGSGKTTLLAHIARQTGIDCIQFITAENVQSLSETLDRALKPVSSIVILDSVESLIEYSPLGPVYSNRTYQSILMMLSKIIPRDRRVIFLLSSSQPGLMRTLQLDTRVDLTVELDDALESGTTIKDYFREQMFATEE